MTRRITGYRHAGYTAEGDERVDWDVNQHQPATDGHLRTMHGRPVHTCALNLMLDQYDPAARHLPHSDGDGWCPGYAPKLGESIAACPDALPDAEGWRTGGHGAHAHERHGSVAWCRGYRNPGPFVATFDPPWNPDDPTGAEADRAAGWHYTGYYQSQLAGLEEMAAGKRSAERWTA